jgi:streptogramin lyase
VDVNGNLYIADYFNNVIRKIDGISGIITTVAGNGGSGYSGNGGPATAGMLRYPSAISVDGSGNIFIADAGNSAIRKVSGGIISAFAGNGINGYSGDGGPAITAEFNAPSGIAVDGWDRVYVADYGNNVIRVITAATGINNIAASPDQPIVYPNPANGSFTITMPVNYEGATIIISDATGRTIFAGETKGSQQFSTHNWMPGTYFISVCSEKAIFHQAILAR